MGCMIFLVASLDTIRMSISPASLLAPRHWKVFGSRIRSLDLPFKLF